MLFIIFFNSFMFLGLFLMIWLNCDKSLMRKLNNDENLIAIYMPHNYTILVNIL